MVESVNGIEPSCSDSKDLERTIFLLELVNENACNGLHCKYCKIHKMKYKNISSHVLWAYNTPLSHNSDTKIKNVVGHHTFLGF